MKVKAAQAVLVHHSIPDVLADCRFLSLLHYSSVELNVAIVKIVDAANIHLLNKENYLLLDALTNFSKFYIFSFEFTKILSSELFKRLSILSKC